MAKKHKLMGGEGDHDGDDMGKHKGIKKGKGKGAKKGKGKKRGLLG